MPPIVKDVVVRFTGEDKDLKRANTTLDQTNQKINATATATQQASTKIVSANQQTAKSFGQMSSTLDQLKGQILATLSVGAVLAFGKAALQSFREAEESARKLSFVIKNIANGSTGDIDRLLKQSKELQDKGIFSDELIQSAQSALITIGLTVDEVEKLVPRIGDASASSEEFEQNLQKVVLGINGSNKGLKTLGIFMSDTKDKTERVAEVTEKLGKFQGGMADALNTSAGAAAHLNNQWDEMMEKVGELISDGLTNVKSSLVDLSNSMDTFGDSAEGTVDSINNLLKGLVEYSTAGLVAFEGSTANAIKVQKEFKATLDATVESLGGDNQAKLLALKIAYDNLWESVSKGEISGDEFKAQYSTIISDLTTLTEDAQKKIGTIPRELSDEEKERILKEQQDLYQKSQELLKSQLRQLRDLEASSFAEGIERDRAMLKVKFDQELEDVEGYTTTANELRLALREKYFLDLAELEEKEKERLAGEREKGAEDEIKQREKDAEEQKKLDELEIERLEKLSEEKIRIERETADALKEIEDAKLDAFSEGFGILAGLAKGNAELQNKILAFEKLASVIEIIVNLQREKASNSAAAAAASLINPTLASVYLAKAVALNQLANVRAGISSGIILAQAIPQLALAKGAVDINGPGTETSDSIPARLSKGETVTTAEKTRKHKSLLLALHNDELEKYINEKYVMPQLNMALGHRWLGSGNGTGNHSLEATLDHKKLAKSFPKQIQVSNIDDLAKAMNKNARKEAMFKRRGVS